MIDVCCIGTLGDLVNPLTRTIMVERDIPEGNEFITDKFLIREWKNLEGSYFLQLPSGTLVGVRGRMEVDKNLGPVIVLEQLTPLTSFRKM